MSPIYQPIASGLRRFAPAKATGRALRAASMALLLAAAGAAVGKPARPVPIGQPRPEILGGSYSPRAVPNEYVVTFGDGIPGFALEGETTADAARRRQALEDSAAAEAAAARAGARIQFRYRAAVIGFAGTLSPSALEAVRRATAGRAHIEPNWEQRQFGPSPARPPFEPRPGRPPFEPSPGQPPFEPRPEQPPFEPRPEQRQRPDGVLSPNALQIATTSVPQGLDRIGQRLLELNFAFHRPAGGPHQVHVYVIDSGIRRTHHEFRRPNGSSRVGVSRDEVGAPTAGCLNHGTHVAGTIGGKTFGVAPFVELHSVRVIECNGNVQSMRAIKGVDWVTAQYLGHKKPSIANMSLEFNLVVTGLKNAVENSIKAGVTYVVAAGNGSKNACSVTPAFVPAAITVASVDQEIDTRAATSNHGNCVDLFAPGVAILSASGQTDNASNRLNGTSFAAPHAAGVAAIILSRQIATPDGVWKAMLQAANVSGTPGWCGVIDRRSGSPNVLLHWGAASSDGKVDSETPGGPAPACPK